MPKNNMRALCALIRPDHFKFASYGPVTNGIGQITRESHQHFWVGYDNQSHELILHPQCPLDYCFSHDVDFPRETCSVHTTDQASFVELAREILVWY